MGIALKGELCGGSPKLRAVGRIVVVGPRYSRQGS